MRSRVAVVAFFIFLSGLLAFLPMVEVTATGSSASPAPSPGVAAQKAQPKQKKGVSQKKKLRPQRTTQQKRQKPKRLRNQQRADDARPTVPFGQTAGRRLPGDHIPGVQRRLAGMDSATDRYIVIYKNNRIDSEVATAALSQEPGVVPTHVYEYVVKGFAARLTPEAKRALEQDPRVESVTRDREGFLDAQTLPRGIVRAGVHLNPVAGINGGGPGVDVDIAIIDTGLDRGHPDINWHAWADCAGDNQFPGWDEEGHGTHVAGTAAAIDNGEGVVGVAPGARIWAMRVFDDNGQLFESYAIECMDLVAQFAQTPFEGQTVDVANMSLRFLGNNDRCDGSDPLNDAVCGMVAAGVTVVASAGNRATDASTQRPGNIDAVITVSALADADGLPGSLSGGFNSVCNGPQTDDGLATFSNYGADVDIAAPGIDVLSTFPTYLNQDCAPGAGQGFEIMSGTSMSTPHVAGAAGLLLALNPNLTPAQVKAALQATRENVAMPGDPDGIHEGILNLGTPPIGDTTGPSGQINAPRSVRAGQRISVRVIASDPSGISRVQFLLCQPRCRPVKTDTSAPYTFVRRHTTPGRVRYQVRVFDNVGNVSVGSITIQVRSRR